MLKLTVQKSGDYVMVSNEFTYDMLSKSEAIELIEKLARYLQEMEEPTIS